ncbi:hypothetical protein QQS21_006053 [Conoideocrella luteorostrata]|uniref:Cytochrome P450 n=1 Tax=Conoideocrella luteorostrata TaxID=1105319 RepID=A0AAJ0CNN2_9HYPO|nr:hypothetical protein QQS21_006053 [Conoideocrella luteorostrata]
MVVRKSYFEWKNTPRLVRGVSEVWYVPAPISSITCRIRRGSGNAGKGPIARISPEDIVTSDAELVKRILAVRSPYTRSEWYNGMRFDPSKNFVLSMREDSLHTMMRSRMAAGYSGKDVEDLEKKVDSNVMKLVHLIDSYIVENKPFDLSRKVHYFTLDVLSDIAFGQPFGNLASDSDKHDYIKNIETYVPFLIISTVMAWIIPVLGLRVFRPFMPSEHDVLGIGRIMGIAKEVAAKRYGPNKKVNKDMVGSFVAHGLTQEQTESEIPGQIVAGSDTTATAIRATLLHIITSPRVLTRLHREIDDTRLSSPTATDSEIRTMAYLQACIKEGLRMFPPAAGFMSKNVPADGDVWKGISFPPGTRIGLSIWGIVRSKEFWGDDADEFRPERWLEATPERRKEMDSTWDIIFSAGKWGCMGRNVAYIEMNKVLVEILRRFDLAVVDPTRPWKSVQCGIFIQSEFWVRATRRDHEAV